MISDSISRLGGVVNQAKLYQAYTDRWIEIQEYRSRVSSEQKRIFMEELGYLLFLRGESSIHYADMPEQIRKIFELSNFESIVVFDEDMRACSFLIRDRDGAYSFVH